MPGEESGAMRNAEEQSEIRLRAGTLRQAERNIAWILAHPGFSDWLKDALRTGLTRDPVQLSNDLELLKHLLHAWTLARIERDLLADDQDAGTSMPEVPR